MDIKIIKTSDMEGGFAAMAQNLYRCSAFTFTGIALESDTLQRINDCLTQFGLKPVEEFYTYTGKDMNEYYGLLGTNRYVNDLTFISFPLYNQNISRLALFKIRMGARWFDDIVDNNARHNKEFE